MKVPAANLAVAVNEVPDRLIVAAFNGKSTSAPELLRAHTPYSAAVVRALARIVVLAVTESPLTVAESETSVKVVAALAGWAGSSSVAMMATRKARRGERRIMGSGSPDVRTARRRAVTDGDTRAADCEKPQRAIT